MFPLWVLFGNCFHLWFLFSKKTKSLAIYAYRGVMHGVNPEFCAALLGNYNTKNLELAVVAIHNGCN